MNPARCSLILVFLLMLVAASAAGRSVEGVVTDEAGKPVPGAVVKLKNTATFQVRSYISGDDGTYRFHGLNINVDYLVHADYQELSSDVERISQFDSHERVVVNLRLKGSVTGLSRSRR